MRRLSDGVVVYSYSNAQSARDDIPASKVWVAANALYRRHAIQWRRDSPRFTILYSGRLEWDKKVDLLLRAFAQSGLIERGIHLTLVGHGHDEAALRQLASDLNVTGSLVFLGPVYDVQRLADLYAEAICSASPGFAGLGLTQSIGFGVPMAVADGELHSPEIELAEIGAVSFFKQDSVPDMARCLSELAGSPRAADYEQWSRHVAENYSAEVMANGLRSALEDVDPTCQHPEVGRQCH